MPGPPPSGNTAECSNVLGNLKPSIIVDPNIRPAHAMFSMSNFDTLCSTIVHDFFHRRPQIRQLRFHVDLVTEPSDMVNCEDG